MEKQSILDFSRNSISYFTCNHNNGWNNTRFTVYLHNNLRHQNDRKYFGKRPKAV